MEDDSFGAVVLRVNIVHGFIFVDVLVRIRFAIRHTFGSSMCAGSINIDSSTLSPVEAFVCLET
jgi:hypothetical protein